jgi:hypothetical protein
VARRAPIRYPEGSGPAACRAGTKTPPRG